MAINSIPKATRYARHYLPRVPHIFVAQDFVRASL